jgi:hypothetical protein
MLSADAPFWEDQGSEKQPGTGAKGKRAGKNELRALKAGGRPCFFDGNSLRRESQGYTERAKGTRGLDFP